MIDKSALHAGRLLRVLPVAMGLLLLLALAAPPLRAGERIWLTSGAHLDAAWHERSAETIRLYAGGGWIELPVQAVARIEERLPAPPPAGPSMPEPGWAPPPAAMTSTAGVRALLEEAASRAGLPPQFVESVALVESAFHPGAVSPKGAIGVMQLMPQTARALGADPHDLRQNIEAGTRLLRELLLKYDGDVVKALSAYNAGEGAVARYQGLPPFTETRRYVNKVIQAYLASGGQ